MCGVAGVYGQPTEDVAAMLNVLAHRGPDGRAVQALPHATLGQVRLAIVDLDGGQQPLRNEDGSRWLVCNGEIYNFPLLRHIFTDYPYQTKTDSEIILALYDRFGPEAVRYLDGMFVFALVESTPEGDHLVLARDPLGIKPLYYGWQDGNLYFASEIKALHGLVPQIEEFPPGHWYSSQTGFFQYYDLHSMSVRGRQRQHIPTSTDDIETTLEQAVVERLMSDVPVGVFLSGGLDSSIIAALAIQHMPKMHSFAVGLEGSDSHDLVHARQVAKFLGTQHHEYIYTPEEMIQALPEIIYYLESFDPLLVRSAIPNYFLSRLAAQYVTVVLTGEGADELYGGYRYLKQITEPTRLHNELERLTAELAQCNLRRCDRMTMAHGLEGRVPFLDTASVELAFAIPPAQKIHRSNFIEKWILRKAFEHLLPPDVIWRQKQQFAQGAGSADFFEQWAEANIPQNEYLIERIRTFARTGYLLSGKEELLYYREFRRHFPGNEILALVKPWRGTI